MRLEVRDRVLQPIGVAQMDQCRLVARAACAAGEAAVIIDGERAGTELGVEKLLLGRGLTRLRGTPRGVACDRRRERLRAHWLQLDARQLNGRHDSSTLCEYLHCKLCSWRATCCKSSLDRGNACIARLLMRRAFEMQTEEILEWR